MNKYWLINYCCKEAKPGNAIVKADILIEAWEKFIEDWQQKYIENDMDYLDPGELQNINIKYLDEDIVDLD
jgi:hypothetical protein